MIKLQNVSFRYTNSDSGALKDVSLTVNDGECVLLCGGSGCGKTTLTRMVNGLIPHYYEGEMSGTAMVDGLNVTDAELYETARQVGSVFQNPRSQFFCVDTTSEIAFGCENMGLPVAQVEQRIRQSASELNMTPLLGRSIFQLSGGEKQKVACASVSAMLPQVFVLDEPTSNLDVDAIEDLRKTLLLWKKQGKTILIAEHRLSWLRDICDRAVYMQDGRLERDIPIETLFSYSPEGISSLGLRCLSSEQIVCETVPFYGKNEMKLRDFRFSYGAEPVLNIPELSLPLGGVIAVIGHNGAGKSTFCRCLCGLEKKCKGKVYFDGVELGAKQLLKRCYMVMQDVNHQLFCESVEDEVRLGMDERNEGEVAEVLSALDIDTLSERHPMSLSGGQKQRVAIASAMLAGKDILIFDEPTSGLDFYHMEQTSKLLSSLKGRKTVFIITHDPELIARCCTHVLHLEQGNVQEFYSLKEDTVSRFQSFFASHEH